MGLTPSQQQLIINGTPRPTSGSLLELIHIISYNEITEKSGSKIVFTVDENGDYQLPTNVPAPLQAYWDALPAEAKNQTALTNAINYQDKMVAFSQRVIRGAKQVKLELQQTVISYLSTEISIGDLGSDEEWSTHILSVITKTFELLAETTIEEQTYFKTLIPPSA